MKNILAFVLLFFAQIFSASAQKNSPADSLFSQKISGEIRSFYMSTANEGALKNWQALALGGRLKYEIAYKKWFAGAAFYTSNNLNISDVNAVDETTGRSSRYEAGLFDINNPNKKEINLLGEFYAGFKTENHFFQIGRFKLNSPLINLQDGRMIPTLVQGLNYRISGKKIGAEILFLDRIAQRNTDGFRGIGQGMGDYPTGRNPDGSPGAYSGQIKSDFVAVAHLYFRPVKGSELDVWNYYVDNTFNTLYSEFSQAFGKEKLLVFNAQLLLQQKVAEGGNADYTKRYFHANSASVYGFQLIFRPKKQTEISINYNRIGSEGRFLFPRGWGVEPLFVFLPRERTEGIADLQAFSSEISHTFLFASDKKLNLSFAYGAYYRPDVKNAELNKYAMPANGQFNLKMNYVFGKKLKGLSLFTLLTYKNAIGNTYDNPNFIINKVNMLNTNIILKYGF